MMENNEYRNENESPRTQESPASLEKDVPVSGAADEKPAVSETQAPSAKQPAETGKEEPADTDMPQIPADSAAKTGSAGGPDGPKAPEMPQPPRPERPAGQIEKASGNPAVAIVLACIALVLTIVGALGGWWLIAGGLGILLAVASAAFAWHAWKPGRMGVLSVSLAVAVTVLSLFSMAQSVITTIQLAALDHMLSPDTYDYYYDYFDDDSYGGSSQYYQDFFGNHDDQDAWYGLDEYNDYWN